MLISGWHWYPFVKSQETKPKCSSQASKSEALPEPNTKAPVVCFSFDAPPADGWGLRSSAEVLRRSGRKSKCILKGVAQQALRKNCLISNNLSWEGDSVMLAACFQGYEQVIRDSLVWFGRWWMILHKRSCCSTWVPRQINMESAKDLRKRIVYSRRMATCR